MADPILERIVVDGGEIPRGYAQLTLVAETRSKLPPELDDHPWREDTGHLLILRLYPDDFCQAVGLHALGNGDRHRNGISEAGNLELLHCLSSWSGLDTVGSLAGVGTLEEHLSS